MNRRKFITSGAAGLGVTLQAFTGRTQQESLDSGPRMRVITYNILAVRGYPETDENRGRLERARDKMLERLALELELYRPDIISLQESVSAQMASRLADILGFRHVWFPPGWPGNTRYPIGFPGTILTRFEIVDSENAPVKSGSRPADLFTRHWGRATLLTEEEEIAFFSAHLHPSNAEIRSREVTEILKVMGPDLEAGRSMLFQGDLNHTPDGNEYQRWVEAGLVDAFIAKGEGPAQTVSSTRPRARIDYIWVHGPLAQRLHNCRTLFEGAFRTNPDDPRSFALSDHLPVFAEFASPKSG
jgi:endonuclease/exonuclease/phosphatase family metal-dependent hydrolase